MFKIIVFVAVLLATQMQSIHSQDGFATLGEGTTGKTISNFQQTTTKCHSVFQEGEVVKQ